MARSAKNKSFAGKLLRSLGPGLITGASDDDPSGIATYSQAGAEFGLSTLWTAWVTFPLMAAIQEMCARIGLATSMGLTRVLKQYYPRWVLYLMLLFSFPAIIMNIGADIAGMGAVANLLVPRVDAAFFSVCFTILLLIFIVLFPYRKIAAVLKYLTMVLLVYLFVPFFIHTDWNAVLKHTLIPHISFNKHYLAVLVGILGTTISPYLFFWQASMEVEEIKEKQKKHATIVVASSRMYRAMETDVNIGMFFSNLVMFFIILTAGTVLAANGIHKIDTVEQAAEALKPLAGDLTYYLFAIGIMGTGLLAIPVLSGALSYIFSEALDLKMGLDKKFHEAKGFYIIIAIALLAGLSLNYLGISPIKALFYSAVLYGLTAPVIIVMILLICNNKTIMHSRVNGARANILGIATLLLMTVAAVALLYFMFTS